MRMKMFMIRLDFLIRRKIFLLRRRREIQATNNKQTIFPLGRKIIISKGKPRLQQVNVVY